MTTFMRKAALTAAGFAFVGGAIGGPVTAAYAAPEHGAKPAAAVAQDNRKPHGGRDLGIRYEAQPNFYYCGPAATRIALTAQDKAPSQDDVARDLGTTENGTNSANDITRVLNKQTGRDAYRTSEIPGGSVSGKHVDKLRADVVKAVDDGRAVVANIAGTATDTEGRAHSYEGGHYLTVVGYADDGKIVKIADPANPDQGSYSMSAEDLARWISSRGYSS
jgi:hypothetical protein